MGEEEISDRLLDQRVRNRMIEVVDMAADWEASLKNLGANSYINAFFDWFPPVGPALWPNSTLTDDERAALMRVREMMDEAAEAPWVTDAELIASGWPQKIAPEAKACLRLLEKRGRFSEDVEEDEPRQI